MAMWRSYYECAGGVLGVEDMDAGMRADVTSYPSRGNRPMKPMKRWIHHTAAVAMFLAAAVAQAAGIVGTTFPPGFPVIEDTSLAEPVIGFGAAGPVTRTPVILLHGNNDTPFPTACNPYGAIRALAQYLADHGYATSELWGLGYQGDQCDLGVDPTLRSRFANSNAANVPELRRIVHAVIA